MSAASLTTRVKVSGSIASLKSDVKTAMLALVGYLKGDVLVVKY